MDNNKINVRNVYIELLNKMKAIEGVDIEYIDRLVALLYEDINFIGNAVDEIMKLIPSGASETDKLVIQSVVTAIQALIPDTATTTNKLATMSDLPAAQVNSDWNAASGVAQILNKPRLPYQIVVTIQASSWSYSPTSQAYVYDYQLPSGFNEFDIPWIGLTGDNPNYDDYFKITNVLIYEMRPIVYVRFKASVQPNNDMMIILLIP